MVLVCHFDALSRRLLSKRVQKADDIVWLNCLLVEFETNRSYWRFCSCVSEGDLISCCDLTRWNNRIL